MPDNSFMRIEPGAAERCAQAFDTHADNLDRVAARLQHAGYSTGFAGFPSAVELDAGFKNKARLAIENLEQQIRVARDYAVSLRAAGARYTETDTVNSTNIEHSWADIATNPDQQ